MSDILHLNASVAHGIRTRKYTCLTYPPQKPEAGIGGNMARKSLVGVVADELLDRIIEGEFPPGSTVPGEH